MLEAAAAELVRAPLYPERAYADFRDAVAGWLGVPPTSVIPAHGAQALIGSIAAAFIDPGTPVVVPNLTYGLYAQVSAAFGAAVTRIDPEGLALDLDALAEAATASGARLLWLCDPNNPTGALAGREAWRRLLDPAAARLRGGRRRGLHGLRRAVDRGPTGWPTSPTAGR